MSPSAFATSVSTANLPTLPSDFEATRSNVASSIFDRQLGLLQPEFTRQRQELESNLINRGIPITSDPYNQASFFAPGSVDTQGAFAAQQAAQQNAYNQAMNQRSANICLLYTSPSPRDGLLSRMPSSA